MKFAIPGPVTQTPRAPRRKYVPCEVATETRDAALAIIKDAIVNDPRSLQKAIGPSGVNNGCTFCLGCTLAQLDQTEEVSWLAFIGHAVHEKLERRFSKEEDWLAEQRVRVGEILGVPVHGNSDNFHLPKNCVVDWKVKWTKGHSKFRLEGPSGQERGQLHLYGRGFKAKGREVDYVAIMALPASSLSLDDAVWWAEPYDEQVALGALRRAERLALEIEVFGAETVIPALDKEEGCYDCPRWILPWEEGK